MKARPTYAEIEAANGCPCGIRCSGYIRIPMGETYVCSCKCHPNRCGNCARQICDPTTNFQYPCCDKCSHPQSPYERAKLVADQLFRFHEISRKKTAIALLTEAFAQGDKYGSLDT